MSGLRESPFPQYRPLGRPSASELNRLGLAVEKLTGLVAPALAVGGHGYQLRGPAEEWFFATVTNSTTSGGVTAYEWDEVFPDGQGGWVTATRSGSADNAPAYEANGLTVALGTNVQMMLVPPGRLVFFAPCGSCRTDPTAITGQGNPTCAPCSNGRYPDTWVLVSSGFMAAPAACSAFNGTWTLARGSDPCSWHYADDRRSIFLTKLAAGSGFRLSLVTLDGVYGIQYTGGTDDCCVTQTVDTPTFTTPGHCGSPPATLTLIPSCAGTTPPCVKPCGQCSGALAPAGWKVNLAGFTDDGTSILWSHLNGTTASVTNRIDLCAWVSTAFAPAPSQVTILWDATNTRWLLRIFCADGSGTVDYYGPASVADCCAPLSFTVSTPTTGCPGSLTAVPSGGCCPAPVGSCSTPCGVCASSLAPATWSVTLSPFSGAFAALNGIVAGCAQQPAGCDWVSPVLTGNGRVTFTGVPGGTPYLLMQVYTPAGGTVNYRSPAAPLDCCTPQTFTIQTATAGCPATLVATPSGGCCPGGGGVAVPCYSGTTLGTVLTATINNVSNCPCWGGQSFAITWNGTSWHGTKTVAGCGPDTLTFDFYPDPTAIHGHCLYGIVSTSDGSVSGAVVTNDPSSPPPAFSWTSSNFAGIVATGCTGSGALNITVTDP